MYKKRQAMNASWKYGAGAACTVLIIVLAALGVNYTLKDEGKLGTAFFVFAGVCSLLACVGLFPYESGTTTPQPGVNNPLASEFVAAITLTPRPPLSTPPAHARAKPQDTGVVPL